MSQSVGVEKVSRVEWSARSGESVVDLADLFGSPEWSDPHALVKCIHCGSVFQVDAVMVDAADGLLVCPVEGCEGTPFDFFLDSEGLPA